MLRKIYCERCSLNRIRLTAVDRFNGYQDRAARLSLVTPESHGYLMAGRFTQVHEVSCDSCGLTIHNGYQAVFVTTWKSKGYRSEPEPAEWESDYGHIIERQ